MEAIYEISYALGVYQNDLPSLGDVEKERIRIAIETKLQVAPDRFGKPLRSPLAGYWSLHIGSYRIVYRISGKTVFVMVIFHRSFGYNKLASIISRRSK